MSAATAERMTPQPVFSALDVPDEPALTSCLGCGRPLSDAESLSRGYGAKCWKALPLTERSHILEAIRASEAQADAAWNRAGRREAGRDTAMVDLPTGLPRPLPIQFSLDGEMVVVAGPDSILAHAQKVLDTVGRKIKPLRATVIFVPRSGRTVMMLHDKGKLTGFRWPSLGHWSGTVEV